MMWEHTGGWGMGWIGLGVLHMVVFWGVIVFVIVVLVRWLSGGSVNPPPAAKSAMDILRERYARGEIDHTEYERMRRDIAE
ncbi:MAG: SHOCT domain-containing protein [Gammaproteobacteria bacterium]|nr:SHOCT domain-containing protein [Gammaproteobacteria bacterium]